MSEKYFIELEEKQAENLRGGGISPTPFNPSVQEFINDPASRVLTTNDNIQTIEKDVTTGFGRGTVLIVVPPEPVVPPDPI